MKLRAGEPRIKQTSTRPSSLIINYGCRGPVAAPSPAWAHTHIAELSKRHELYDVAGRLLACVGAQHAAVPVQELHGSEVGIAHTHNDNGHGQL